MEKRHVVRDAITTLEEKGDFVRVRAVEGTGTGEPEDIRGGRPVQFGEDSTAQARDGRLEGELEGWVGGEPVPVRLRAPSGGG